MKPTKSRRSTAASSSKPAAKRYSAKANEKVERALQPVPGGAAARKKAKPRSGMRMTAV